MNWSVECGIIQQRKWMNNANKEMNRDRMNHRKNIKLYSNQIWTDWEIYMYLKCGWKNIIYAVYRLFHGYQ